jgi:hypothetical protein
MTGLVWCTQKQFKLSKSIYFLVFFCYTFEHFYDLDKHILSLFSYSKS